MVSAAHSLNSDVCCLGVRLKGHVFELVRWYGSSLAVKDLDNSSDGVGHLDLQRGRRGGGGGGEGE